MVEIVHFWNTRITSDLGMFCGQLIKYSGVISVRLLEFHSSPSTIFMVSMNLQYHIQDATETTASRDWNRDPQTGLKTYNTEWTVVAILF